ncbi:Undecaprenyl diphosphate synthase [Mucinivorans hirudinis]|uniref:Isoprenyl transferase n=1 Tax=Mucinivorans hirudinis TaxID=1433126 RepID=A0A060R9B2_9BACT|nr:Undecaprenyl diphosphate synthase [Mucinivorans hirudinis]
MEKFEKIPRHVAVIMDGNGRWARGEGQQRLFGHHRGVDSVRQVVSAARELGVEYLTLYAFSTENWGRSAEEVDGLMELLAFSILNELPQLTQQQIKFRFIGDTTKLPSKTRQSIELAEQTVVEDVKMHLVIAVNYSSRWEIVEAVKSIVREGIAAGDVTVDTISDRLQTVSMPDPDLMIRTSGEQRLSNFLLWQLSYAELYFTPVLWPEFDGEQFREAIKEYNSRDRRFGLAK